MKTLLFRCIGALAVAILASPAVAVEEYSAIWSGITMSDDFDQGSTGSRWSYWVDAQARYVEPGSGARQYLGRFGILYDASENLTVGGGYARGYLHNARDERARENRFFQQLTWSLPELAGGRPSLRLRVEQRELDIAEDWRYRGRLQLKYSRPFHDGSTTRLLLASEAFFNLNDSDWGGHSGLVEHRGSVGIALAMSPAWAVELGYLNQYVFGQDGVDRMAHAAVLHFRYRP